MFTPATSAATATTSTTLADLPPEVAERMSVYLTKHSLFAFRLTCSANQVNSYRTFATRYRNRIDIVPTTPNLQSLVSKIEQEGWGSYVKTLRVIGVNRRSKDDSDWNYVSVDEEGVKMLKRLFRKLTAVHTLNIENGQSSEGLGKALASQPLPSLAIITIHGGKLSESTITKVLSAHTSTLRRLDLNRIQLDNSSCFNILKLVRDSLQLKELRMDDLIDTASRSSLGLHAPWLMPYQDVQRCFGFQLRCDKVIRSPETLKLEVYAMREWSAEMKGAHAVKAGLNRLMLEAGNKHFDATLPH